ncbi:hypothetical protein Bca101_033214 [Brassica carinata]
MATRGENRDKTPVNVILSRRRRWPHVVQGHGCEKKSRVCFVVFPFTGVKEVTGVKFHFYK